MQQFKVGDWITGGLLSKPTFIKEESYAQFLNTEYTGIYIELWQPKQGEWCWFYDKTSSAVPILAQFDYMSEHIYVTTEIKIPLSGEERLAYGFNSCIPFIGQLPKILKD